jgi:uncharacterized surface protein with fasciclin (FAS1) repeats
MKKIISFSFIALVFLGAACNNGTNETKVASATESTPGAGQSAVQDNESAKDVVKVAEDSKDHTTLVAAIKKAELVDALSNAGPFTVFAPTNAAFDKLPKGTLEDFDETREQSKAAGYFAIPCVCRQYKHRPDAGWTNTERSQWRKYHHQ